MIKNKSRVYELTLGYKCNSNCLFCSIDYQKRKLNKTTRQAFSDISQAKKEGFRSIGFGGGEPTIRRDIVKLVSFAKKLGFETIRIQTNGMMLGYKNFCKELVYAGANFFKISIHGNKPEIHDKLTMVPGSFKKSLEGVENAKLFGARTEIDIVINKLNYRFLPQFIEFFSVIKKVSNFVLIYPIYTGRMKENFKLIGIEVSKVVPFITEAIDLASGLKLDKCLVMNIPLCFFKELNNGSVSKYRKALVTNLSLKVNSPQTIIEDADQDAVIGKVMIKKCIKCPIRPSCDGIWKSQVDIFGEQSNDI